MTKNAKQVILGLTAAAIVLGIALMLYDRSGSGGGVIPCNGETHRRIDLRDFQTKYSGYSVQVEASLSDKQKLTGKIEPIQLQSMTEALQQANEFRKYLVAGYNACAITNAQYGEFEKRYQTLDNLARQINALFAQQKLTQSDRAVLAKLVKEYTRIAGELSGR